MKIAPATTLDRLKYGIGQRARGARQGIFSQLRDVFGLLRGIYPVGRGEPPDLSTQNFLETYETHPWVHAILGKIAWAVATSEWHVLGELGPGGKAVKNAQLQRAPFEARAKGIDTLRKAGKLREYTEHPLLNALHASNPLLIGVDIMKLSQLGLDLVGDAFLMKERNALGTVIGLWPIPAHWVIALPTPSAPSYLVQWRAWNGTIPETEILWLHDPGPVNPYGRGSGVIRALGDDIEISIYSSKHAKQLFFNRAQPDFIVQMDGAGNEEVDRLEMHWTQRLQGFWRQFKPYFVNRKLDIYEFNKAGNLTDLALVPLKEHERDVLVHGLGFPPELLGMIQNSNKATITVAEHLFSKWVVRPRLEWLRLTLQARLVPEYDERIILEYDSPVAADDEFKLGVMKAAPYAWDVDEWRKFAGDDPIGGDLGKARSIALQAYLTNDPLNHDTRPSPHPPMLGEDKPDEAKPPTAPPAKPPKKRAAA